MFFSAFPAVIWIAENIHLCILCQIAEDTQIKPGHKLISDYIFDVIITLYSCFSVAVLKQAPIKAFFHMIALF